MVVQSLLPGVLGRFHLPTEREGLSLPRLRILVDPLSASALSRAGHQSQGWRPA